MSMQKKLGTRILTLMLTAVMLMTLLVVLGAAPAVAAGEITLYTAGGSIDAMGWEQRDESEPFVYKGSGTALPTPVSEAFLIQFDGWYGSPKLEGSKVTTGEAGKSYYAKWIVAKKQEQSDSMLVTHKQTGIVDGGIFSFQLLSATAMNAEGVGTNGKNITCTFADGGYAPFYSFSSSNNNKKVMEYNINQRNDVFKAGEGNPDIYFAVVSSFEGAFVRMTFLIQNRGSADVTNIGVGAMADVQIGRDDFAPLKIVNDSSGRYVVMQETGGGAFRLYIGGDNVSDVSTLWTGKFNDRWKNAFIDAPYNRTGIDSALAFSWKDIGVKAGETVSRSVLLGCGDPAKLTPTLTIKLNPNGGAAVSPEQIVCTIKENVTLPQATRYGYTFEGWSTMQAGGTIIPSGSFTAKASGTLYAQWKAIPNTVNVALEKDDSPWSGQTIELYQDGQKKYELTGSGNTYSNAAVIAGEYDVYLNGSPTGRKTTVAIESDGSGTTVNEPMNYFTADVTTRLDNSASDAPGLVTLRQDGAVKYTAAYSSGKWTVPVLIGESNEYSIYVAGADTGKTVSSESKNNTVDFCNAKLALTYGDGTWSPKVTLRDGGEDKYVLGKKTGTGNTLTYSHIIQVDENDTPTVYSVFVDGQDTKETLKLVVNESSAAATFYKAVVTLKLDGSNWAAPTVTLNQGGDVRYPMSGSNGTYTASYVLKTMSSSTSERDYNISVSGTIGNAGSVSSSNKTPTISYNSVSYYSDTGSTGSGTTPYYTQYVKSGSKTEEPPPPYRQGLSFLDWYKENTLTNAFDFTNTTITSATKLYAGFTKPSVAMNAYDAGGSGSHYTLKNLTIRGYSSNSNAMKYALLELTNCAVVTLPTGSYTVTPGKPAETVSFSGDAKIYITFGSSTSMQQAQELLRQIQVKVSNVNAAHTVKVTVYGDTY